MHLNIIKSAARDYFNNTLSFYCLTEIILNMFCCSDGVKFSTFDGIVVAKVYDNQRIIFCL